MTQSPLSINVKPWAVKDWPGCLTFLKQLNPTAVVVAVDQIDQLNRILETQEALPATKIVARFIDEKHDGSMHLKPQTNSDKYIVSPQNQLNRIRAFGVNGRSAYFGNEPDTKASPDDLFRLANHTIEAMDLAASRDYDMSLTILNLGIGHPKPVDGLLPSWMNPVLLKLNEHHNRHYYGLHAYLPLDILEHLKALKKTCEFLKIPLPRCIITEFGFDSDGTSPLNGFKSRDISAEHFAEWCIDTCQDEFRTWLESGDLLGICIFIYGDSASWFEYDVETGSNPNEVSTAWRDAILKAKLAGQLDMQPTPPTLPVRKRDIVFGQRYRVRKPGDVIRAYLLPYVGPAPNYQSIPDNAVVTVLGKETTNGETWLKVTYANFTGVRYIQADLIDYRETVTVPVVNIPPETPAVKPDEPPTNAPSSNGQTDVKNENGTSEANLTRNSDILTQLKVIRGAIDALITLLDVQEPIKA